MFYKLVYNLFFKGCLLGFALLLRASAIQARLMALGLASLGRFSTSRTVSFCFSLTYIARYARV